MDEDDSQEPGAGWLDEADADLERFMQEDALLDAIQNAPGLEPAVQAFEVESGDASRAAGASAGAPHHRHGSSTGMVSLAAGGIGGHHENVSSSGPKERRTDGTDAHARASGRGEADTGPAAPETEKAKSRPSPGSSATLHGGLLAALATISGMLLWGPSLWEAAPDQSKLLPAVYAEPRKIQMPALGDEDSTVDLTQPPPGNGTGEGRFGVQRGRIGVRWSSDSASNVTALAGQALAGNGTSSASDIRGERGRRGRMRAKGGAISDLR